MPYERPTYATIDEITCSYEEAGTVLRRQVAKRVVDVCTVWATIAFAWQDRDRVCGWRPVRLSVTKWQRVAGRWRRHSGVNVRPDMALAIASLFEEWGSMGDGLAELGL